jgi:IS30 family transposase
MVRGYQRLSPEVVDDVWARLRSGHAAKPTARQLGLSTGTVRAYLIRCGANPALRDIVVDKLRRRWSPQQIAGWLQLTYPERPEMQVSHESIYRTLYVQSRGALNKELTRYLRTYVKCLPRASLSQVSAMCAAAS